MSDHAIALSRELKRYGGKFVLGKRKFIPHISLYHIPVRRANLDAFSQTVEAIASSHRGAELQLRSIEMPLLMTDRPRWLKELHLDVVNQTSRYFDWDYGAEDTWNVEALPSRLRVRAKEYLEEFGSPLIDTAFRPHITLTSFEDNSVAKNIPPSKFEPMTFQVDKIWICELGPSHSVQRTLASYPLGV